MEQDKNQIGNINIAQEQIDNAINECKWLSQNQSDSLIPGICSGYCLPCTRIIEIGKCDTLIALFSKCKE